MFFIKNRLPKYDFIWYLTAPYNVRLERHTSQVKRKENPDKLEDRFPGEIVFNDMESKLKKLLSVRNKIEREFDTTRSSYEKVIDHTSKIIKDRIAVDNMP